MNYPNENLKELFGKFLTSQEAQQAAEDVRKADEMLAKYTSPMPDAEAVADIKAKTAAAVGQRKTKLALRRTTYRISAVAAAILIIASVGVVLLQKNMYKPATGLISNAVWDSYDLSEDDPELAILTTEVKQAEMDMSAIHLGESWNSTSIDSTEAEMELVEIGSLLEKG